MQSEAGALPGQHLCAVLAAGPLGQPDLVDRYRGVLEHGHARSFAQVHIVEGRPEVVIHRVVPEDDGVGVMLINLSANRRAQIARLQVSDPQASLPRRQAR